MMFLDLVLSAIAATLTALVVLAVAIADLGIILASTVKATFRQGWFE
jgi:hypothetical protein